MSPWCWRSQVLGSVSSSCFRAENTTSLFPAASGRRRPGRHEEEGDLCSAPCPWAVPLMSTASVLRSVSLLHHRLTAWSSGTCSGAAWSPAPSEWGTSSSRKPSHVRRFTRSEPLGSSGGSPAQSHWVPQEVHQLRATGFLRRTMAAAASQTSKTLQSLL